MRHVLTRKNASEVTRMTSILAEERDSNGGCYSYHIKGAGSHCRLIEFQRGPVNVHGQNGISDEILLAILIDRMQGFQEGPLRNRHTAIALTHLETAMLWLNERTADRESRGVDGTDQLYGEKFKMETPVQDAAAYCRAEVLAFAIAMETELRANDDKPGWKNDDPLDLCDRIDQELHELIQAIKGNEEGGAPDEVVKKEAADIGNFAMMIWDIVNANPTTKPA